MRLPAARPRTRTGGPGWPPVTPKSDVSQALASLGKASLKSAPIRRFRASTQ
jgi:hypothetical protein